MKLWPCGKKLLVQLKKEEEKKGIVLVNKPKDEPYKAIVIQKGDKSEIECIRDDILVISPYGGMKIAGGTEEEPYLIVDDQSVIGVLK